MQENKPIGTTILQLSVIDRDSSRNGPPFSFQILSGNEGREFVLKEDGTLTANQVFRREFAKEYVIQIQVRPSFCWKSVECKIVSLEVTLRDKKLSLVLTLCRKSRLSLFKHVIHVFCVFFTIHFYTEGLSLKRDFNQIKCLSVLILKHFYYSKLKFKG